MPLALPPPSDESVSHLEKWWSSLGGFVGILLTLFASQKVLGIGEPALAMVASMGASSVLLFAVPKSPLSHPWNFAMGHLVSAAVGVSVARLGQGAPPAFVAAAAAGLAILAMYYGRCLHPPGGATALVAVMGGARVHELGFGYVIAPVLINVAILLFVAVVFGSLSRVRRYPAMAATVPSPPSSGAARPTIDHDDLVYALARLDTFVDVGEDDLLAIYHLATGHHADEEVRNRMRRSEPAPRADEGDGREPGLLRLER